MPEDTGFEEETRRFLGNARRGLEDRRNDRIRRLKEESPRFFEGARQGLHVLRPVAIELDRHLARKFDCFRFIHLDENRMSDVFAYLLDPEETHGQRKLFLREFLSHVFPKGLVGYPRSGVRIGREMRTTRIEDWDRRIDIEIAFRTNGGLAAIAIENKPWAGDQENQLSDYARHLELKYKGRFNLIYLTPKGEDPSENSIKPEKREKLSKEGKLANASIQDWASDHGWLKRGEDGVKAERVRWFVSDFRKALIESLPELGWAYEEPPFSDQDTDPTGPPTLLAEIA